MAYVQSPIPQEQQNTQAPQGITTSNPLSMLPPQTGGSSGQGGTSSAATPKTPGVGSPTQFGTNATKLSDYLSANSDQIQTMGNNIAGNLGSQFGQVQGDVNNAVSGFGQAVQRGFTPDNPELTQMVATNPVAAAPRASEFQTLLNDQYTGPAAFEQTAPYTSVQGEVNNAVQNAGLLNSPAGLSTYLQNNVEKNPTPGQNTLDTVLLQSQPQAIKAVQDAAAPFAGLTNYLTGQTTKANQGVQNAQQIANQARTNAQGSLRTATNNLSNTIQSSLRDATGKSSAYNQELNDITQKINSGNFSNLTLDEQRLIGFNPQLLDFEKTYPTIFPTQAQNNPIDFSSYFTQGPQASTPSIDSVVTPDQVAQYQALTTLGGSQPALPFAMPSISAAPNSSLPGIAPSYNDRNAANAMYTNYLPMYRQLQASGSVPKNITDFMTSLSNYLGTAQPLPQPPGPNPGPPVISPQPQPLPVTGSQPRPPGI